MSLESINLVEFLLGLLFSLILPDPKEFNVWIRGIIVFSLGVVLPYLCYHDPNSCMSLWPFNLFFDFFHQELQINDPYITLLFLSFFVSFLLGCFTMLYGFLHLISNQWQFFDYIHLSLPVHITDFFGSSSNQPVRKKIKAKKKKRRNLRVAIVIALWLCLMVIIFRQEIFNLVSYMYISMNSPPSSQVQSTQTTTEPSSYWFAFLDVLSISQDGQVVEEQVIEVGPAPKKKKRAKPAFEDDDDDKIDEFDDFDWDEDDTETEKMQAKKKFEEKTKKKQEKDLKKMSKTSDAASRTKIVKEQFLAWLKDNRKTHFVWTWLNPLQRPDAYYSLWIGSGSLSFLFCLCVWKIHKIQERQDMEARKAGQQQVANPNSKNKNRKSRNAGNANSTNHSNKDNAAGLQLGTDNNNNNNAQSQDNNDLKDSTESAANSRNRTSKKKRKKLSSSDGVMHAKVPTKNYPL